MNMIVIIAPVMDKTPAMKMASVSTERQYWPGLLDEHTLLKQFKQALEQMLSNNSEMGGKKQRLVSAERHAMCPLLSPRENEILTFIAKGLTQKEIARLLGLSPATVGTYRKDIYRKLGVSSAAEATLEAIRYRLVEPDLA